jgi:hypothetical protein
MSIQLPHFNPNQLPGLGINHMDRTGNTRIKTMYGAQNLQGLFWIMEHMARQSRLIRTGLTAVIPWSSIPGAGDYSLIVVNLKFPRFFWKKNKRGICHSLSL